MRVVKSLRRGDESVSQLALELVCALMVPLHQAWDIRQEQLNKASLLSSPKFLASLLDMWAVHVVCFSFNRCIERTKQSFENIIILLKKNLAMLRLILN